ncbi:hypothetical protein [Leyella stercorea]|uniref:hypothetical protein n=1 Tax=Leyella stercorea TaxID=363265 RepID=UPI001F1A28CC|nr:hypothetical protein [Leyella stercorea]MCF2615313.1 hypothetical protein [Leyella stercorea]
MDFKIVFIDDNLSVDEPFVQNIRKHYKDADYKHVFQNPDEGLKYVLENLNNKMIVFIDWNFSGYKKKGIDLLKEIRKKTSLLYIVMMSANQLRTDIPLDSIVEMMNEDNFFYLDRSNDDFESVVAIINKIRTQWSTKFDCVLEQWLIRHPEDNYKEAYSETSTGKTYTWENILVELRKQTPIGKAFEQKLNEYYIYQLNRSKK